MLTRIRSRFSYANVVSTLCLFGLLAGGGAYAATQLAKNSVGTAQLKNGAVTKKKISAATRAALKGAKGPRGPQGLRGLQGVAGTAGPSPSFARIENIPAAATYSGPVSGTAPGSFTIPVSAQLSPSVQITAKDLSVKLPTGTALDGPVVVTLNTGTTATTLSCTVLTGATTCSDSTHAVTVPPGSELFFTVHNASTAPLMAAEVGWRAT